MVLETTFYVMGIIFMTLNILILITIGVGIFVLYKKVMEIQNHISRIIEHIEYIVKHPEDVAVNMGASAAASAYNKVKNLMKRSGKE